MGLRMIAIVTAQELHSPAEADYYNEWIDCCIIRCQARSSCCVEAVTPEGEKFRSYGLKQV